MGYDAGLHLYAYVGNDPVNNTDPKGKCPQCLSGLIGGGIGAIVNVAAQLITDVATGQEITLGNVIGAAAGGFTTGSIIGSTGQVGLGVTAGAAVQSATTQFIETGTVDATKTVADTAVGTVAGRVPGLKIGGSAGVTKVAKTAITKVRNGTISRISIKTAGKIALSEGAGSFGPTSANLVSAAIGAPEMIDTGLEKISDVMKKTPTCNNVKDNCSQ